jgi:mono/diheme cytochrome c family protein
VIPKKIAITLATALILAIAAMLVWFSRYARGFSAREKPSALEAFLAEQARHVAVPDKAKELHNPVPYSEQVIEEARSHWADHCAYCHANDGSGDAEVGRNLYPPAPDMRQRETQAKTDGELYYTIENGIRLSGMPAWGSGGFNDEDTWKLVYFIRHLPKVTAQEVEAMKKLNPRSPMELMEEQQEEEFLNEGTTKGTQRRE